MRMRIIIVERMIIGELDRLVFETRDADAQVNEFGRL